MPYCVLVATVLALFFGLREPRLGRGEDETIERTLGAHVKQLDFQISSSQCGVEPDDEPRPYDVNAALRSDELWFGDVPPEGDGPARRRYVRAEPDPFMAGSIRLVR